MSETLTEPETDAAHLDAYVDDVCALVARDLRMDELVERVAALNRELVSPGFRLPEQFRRIDATVPYTRNLVYQDPDKRMSVIAICWGPFQQTRVHDHLNWGVVSVLEGLVHEVEYDRVDDESDPWHAELRMRKTALHAPGGIVALAPPPSSNIHVMANAGHPATVTLHTYGDPGTKARVFDPATGVVELLDLPFHNT
ncbi:MAG: hypothetical protein CMJ83_14450 [Planctomycetes bacterium]|nr:hypothetical protein [Planctomycetota bacterium]